jgi:hypothetical protein
VSIRRPYFKVLFPIDRIGQIAPPRLADEVQIGIENRQRIAAVGVLFAVPAADVPADVKHR